MFEYEKKQLLVSEILALDNWIFFFVLPFQNPCRSWSYIPLFFLWSKNKNIQLISSFNFITHFIVYWINGAKNVKNIAYTQILLCVYLWTGQQQQQVCILIYFLSSIFLLHSYFVPFLFYVLLYISYGLNWIPCEIINPINLIQPLIYRRYIYIYVLYKIINYRIIIIITPIVWSMSVH